MSQTDKNIDSGRYNNAKNCDLQTLLTYSRTNQTENVYNK